jgi:broad specificity phosphatase PhoE
MKVDIIRHAQSLFNKYLISEKDCDLSEEGIVQAEAIQAIYDVVVLSPLRRTHQTLSFSGIKTRRILLTDLCREKRTDICDYLVGEDETQKETVEEVKVRIELFKEFLRREIKEGQKVLVVSHGDFIWTATGGAYPENAEMRSWEF